MILNETDANSADQTQRRRRLLSKMRMVSAHMMEQEQDLPDSVLHFGDRLRAIARTAEAAAMGGIDLESLVLDELWVYGAYRGPIAVGGPAVLLTEKSAEFMGLAIHELATNSIKYGALSQSQTRLRVVWWFADTGSSRLHFEWLEDGIQMAAGSGRKVGFGSRLVTSLIASELNGEGEMSFMRDGMACTIEIPLGEALHQS
jgi:two-component system, chemotaxis family, CheB/CheR fusion protein